MCCDCYKEFFGEGLDPLPATYKLKQGVLALVCMNLVHMIVIVSNRDKFETDFIMTNLIIASIGIVFLFILLKGAHEKNITTIYFCEFINILYCCYMIYFMCYFFSLILSKPLEDTFAHVNTYYTIADGIFNILSYIIAIYEANKATEEIKNEESTANEFDAIQQHQVEHQTREQVSNVFGENIDNFYVSNDRGNEMASPSENSLNEIRVYNHYDLCSVPAPQNMRSTKKAKNVFTIEQIKERKQLKKSARLN